MYKADIGRYAKENLAHSEVWVGKAPVTQCCVTLCNFRSYDSSGNFVTGSCLLVRISQGEVDSDMCYFVVFCVIVLGVVYKQS